MIASLSVECLEERDKYANEIHTFHLPLQLLRGPLVTGVNFGEKGFRAW